MLRINEVTRVRGNASVLGFIKYINEKQQQRDKQTKVIKQLYHDDETHHSQILNLKAYGTNYLET